MSEFTFDDEHETVRPQAQNKDGVVTELFKRISFGHLQTKRQIQIAQIILILFGLLYVYSMLGRDRATVQPTPPELINAPQPLYR